MPSKHGGQHFRLVPHSELLNPYCLAISFDKLQVIRNNTSILWRGSNI